MGHKGHRKRRQGPGGLGLRRSWAGRARKQIGDGEHLGGENAVHTSEAESAFAVEEVRDVGLAKPCLPSEQRTCKSTAVDATEQFQTEPLVQVKKVHSFQVSCER